MRLVIDLQGAQASSRARGIGRYALLLTQALLRQRGEHEVLIALNGCFADTVAPVKSALAGLIPAENIKVWDTPAAVFSADPDNAERRVAAELIRESFLANLRPDWILIASTVEGLSDDVVVSIGQMTSDVPTAAILYDLIPLIHKEIYLTNPVSERWYLSKMDQLKKADLLLAISTSSGAEAVAHLGFDPLHVVNISAAVDERFTPGVVSAEDMSRLQKQYGLVRPFIMYTGGIDHRKNIEGLIAAYAKLPVSLRRAHQLAVVCSVQAVDRARLQKLAAEAGLGSDELVLTGFVSDDDLLTCYRACKFFVFPSWHEGFGLPALEAMQCGKAVIATDCSSLPEVVGRSDALFKAHNVQAITDKMFEVLENDAYRVELEQHGLTQATKFSWDASARITWEALEVRHGMRAVPKNVVKPRPRLAYISPLPPESSGISDYSAELLPALAVHYDIEVVVSQPEVTSEWVRNNHPIRSVQWFQENATNFDRILYHFGNSHFHSHMFGLLQAYPGAVVLHDFYLSGIVAHRELTGELPHGWARSLVECHGWAAVAERFQAKDIAEVIYRYPCNLPVLQDALGIIVHADYSRQLAMHWYGPDAADRWEQIPHLRQLPSGETKAQARATLEINEGDFVVCSLGFVAPTKLNHRLLNAWLTSPLALDPKCRLVFVGRNHEGDYGKEFLSTIKSSEARNRITITGWADGDIYRRWLAASDLGVQLRTMSRGETSGTVLDCMNYGLATIINANGSMAEMPENAVWMLPDSFEDEELMEALVTLWQDKVRREQLGAQAQMLIATKHSPAGCAAQYAAAIERFYADPDQQRYHLAQALKARSPILADADWAQIARAVARNIPAHPACRQLLVDISDLHGNGLHGSVDTGLATLLRGWLTAEHKGWHVEPVYFCEESSSYRYARFFVCRLLGLYDGWVQETLAEAWDGDVMVRLVQQPEVSQVEMAAIQEWFARGVAVQFLLDHDLGELGEEPAAAEIQAWQSWLQDTLAFDGVICLSSKTAHTLEDWLREADRKRTKGFVINSVPTNDNSAKGSSRQLSPDQASQLLQMLAAVRQMPQAGAPH
ncbi:glycosyltransferase [Silvimonas amylolytica]|uniref:Mannosyltransferase A n=1 Tax=Silvimonas amylolytica TaxID=449663 RepID=A0ABQ2PK84_9NEIS|nr:glycosyltransferase [Silvimonas amylolytica]GGP25432.1 mannosyltransferase A [Silvimonas amylolytica]